MYFDDNNNAVILGISGSIGESIIWCLKHYHRYLSLPSNFFNKINVVAVSFHHDFTSFKYVMSRFHPKYVAVSKEEDYLRFKDEYPKVTFYYGENSIVNMLNEIEYDVCFNAISGFAGFLPSVTVLKRKKKLVLANKESLVVGGFLLNKYLGYDDYIYSMDSEHAAIYACSYSAYAREVESITITASGGPFLYKDKSSWDTITKEEALHHPNWRMGKRISIDSATMMNKCFELIEAYYLFRRWGFSNCNVLVDSTSNIHGFMENKDGSIIYCEYAPSMKIPIMQSIFASFEEDAGPISRQYNTEDFCKRFIKKTSRKSDLFLKKLDIEKFPLIKLYERFKIEKNSFGAVLNAIDEELVKFFLDGVINFIDIEKYIVKIIDNYEFVDVKDEYEIVEVDKIARKTVRNLVLKDKKIWIYWLILQILILGLVSYFSL